MTDNRTDNRLTMLCEMSREINVRRVGGEVTQRIANPSVFPTKSTKIAHDVIRTNREHAVNVITHVDRSQHDIFVSQAALADDFKSSQSIAVSKAWLRGFPRTEQKQGVNVGNDLPTALSHALSQIGVVNPRPPTPRPACYAEPQWKPTCRGEQPPF